MYLAHYGVKGMKWGVRHDKKSGDIHIRKGTKINRLSIYDESQSKGHAYVTYRNDDSRHYRGFFARRLKLLNDNADVYKIKLEAANELIAPSRKKQIDTFVELHKNDPMISKKMAEYHKHDHIYFTPLPTKAYEFYYKNMPEKQLRKKGFYDFSRTLGDKDSYNRNAYFDVLSKKGYNYIIDTMDAGRFGKEPAIVFDRDKDLIYKGQDILEESEINKIFLTEGGRIDHFRNGL